MEKARENARRAAVISTPDLGVLAVAAAGVLCAFCCVVNTLPEQCLRRRPRANPLVAAVFRTKRLLRERCSATCPRRRRPGQVRHTQGGLQITADLRDDPAVHRGRPCRTRTAVLSDERCAATLGTSAVISRGALDLSPPCTPSLPAWPWPTPDDCRCYA